MKAWTVRSSDLRCPDCGRGTWSVEVVTAPQPSIAVAEGQQIKGQCPTCGQVNRPPKAEGKS